MISAIFLILSAGDLSAGENRVVILHDVDRLLDAGIDRRRLRLGDMAVRNSLLSPASACGLSVSEM